MWPSARRLQWPSSSRWVGGLADAASHRGPTGSCFSLAGAPFPPLPHLTFLPATLRPQRRSLYVVELDIVPTGSPSASSAKAQPADATASSSVNRVAPASTSSGPRASDGPSAVLRGPVDLGPPPSGRPSDVLLAAAAAPRHIAPDLPPDAAAADASASPGDAGKAASASALAAGLRRGFFNRGSLGGGSAPPSCPVKSPAGAAANPAATGAVADPAAEAGEEPAAGAKKRYSELSPPVMSRVAVALSKVVEATRTEVNEGRSQPANSVLMDPVQRRANLAKRAVRPAQSTMVMAPLRAQSA